MRRIVRWTAVFALILALSGCMAITDDTVIITPSFSTSSGSDGPVDQSSFNYPGTVAILPFLNSTENPEAAGIVRTTVFNHFASKNYHSLHLREVDRRLAAAGMTGMEREAYKELIRNLRVAGLIYGEVTEYDKIYLGVYAQVAVGVKLYFINRQGEVIWEGEHAVRKHEGGISTSAVGIVLQAVAAALHVRDINLFRAADELGRELMAKIPEPELLGRKPGIAITRVVHDGGGRILKYGDELTVVLEGESGGQAFARVEGMDLIPLAESDPGVYEARVPIPRDLDLNGIVLVGVLEDAQGQLNEKIATTGLVFIDNTPPGQVNNLTLISRDGEIALLWDADGEQDVEKFLVSFSSTSQGPFELLAEVTDNRFSHSGLENFSQAYYRVSASDRAGNVGNFTAGSGMATPDQRFAEASRVRSFLPTSLDGVSVLTAANSPYILHSETTVPKTATLLVEPGVDIQITGSGILKVQGELRIYGDKGRPVRAFGKDGASFTTFLELMSDRSVWIAGLEVQGGGIPIVITRGAPEIIHSRILNSSYNALELKGVSRPQIRFSIIQGSQGGAAIITDKSRPVFQGNYFADNGPIQLQCNSPYFIDARDNLWENPAASPQSILTDNGCVIETDQSGGVK